MNRKCDINLKDITITRKTIQGNNLELFHKFNLIIKGSEITSVIGPSGCGKSTLMDILCGLLKVEEGIIEYGRDPIELGAVKTGVAFQNYNLFPWMNVYQNISFAMKQERLSHKQLQEKVWRIIERVQLKGFENYYPHELSGGMQQRTSLARTLVTNPDILILDEAFKSLDAHTRGNIYRLISKLHKKENYTIINITHDIHEAISISDSIVVLGGFPTKVVKIFSATEYREQQRTTELYTEILNLLDNRKVKLHAIS